MAKRPVAMLLTTVLALSGCAAATDVRLQTVSGVGRAHADREVLAEYVQKLPVGSRVRVHLVDGRRERGTLMSATPEHVILQPRTRIPEPPVRILFDTVVAVELEPTNGGSVARAIAIGVTTGAGAILGVMLLLAAIYAD